MAVFDEPDTIHIRSIDRGLMHLAIEWAHSEGWNPGLHDDACFHAADPGGFLMAFAGEEPVGCISVVEYGANESFLGLFIVRPNMRGFGVGARLWSAGIHRLRGRNIGLDAVTEHQARYARAGFVHRHRNIRFAGLPRRPSSIAHTERPDPSEWTRIAEFDAIHFGERRDAFLKAWIGSPQHETRVAFDAAGKITAYGTIRQCRDGYKIGPLFARFLEAADTVFDALVETIPLGSRVILDCPEPNENATSLASEKGLEPIFETARMVRGRPLALPLDRIFGITSLELG